MKRRDLPVRSSAKYLASITAIGPPLQHIGPLQKGNYIMIYFHSSFIYLINRLKQQNWELQTIDVPPISTPSAMHTNLFPNIIILNLVLWPPEPHPPSSYLLLLDSEANQLSEPLLGERPWMWQARQGSRPSDREVVSGQ